MNTTAIDSVKGREEVPTDDQWNVGALFSSFDEWEKEYAQTCERKTPPRWPKLQMLRGRLHEGEAVLKEALSSTFSLSRQLEKLYTYAHLRHDEEITSDVPKKAFQRISALLYDFQQESAWLDPEILSLPADLAEAAQPAGQRDQRIQRGRRLRPPPRHWHEPGGCPPDAAARATHVADDGEL